MTQPWSINPSTCTDKLALDYAHVGLFDTRTQKIFIALRPPANQPQASIRLAHARLLQGVDADISSADKDHFLCLWFHPPDTGQGYVQGYPIEWSEGHVLIRLDPLWNYSSQKILAPTDAGRIERNVEQQYAWGQRIFKQYLTLKPRFPVSWHLIGPRPTDSMFYIQRVEPRR